MNHITKLTLERDQLKQNIESAKADIDRLKTFLNGPKFTGTDLDGSRKDWISTGDVYAWLSDIRATLMENVF